MVSSLAVEIGDVLFFNTRSQAVFFTRGVNGTGVIIYYRRWDWLFYFSLPEGEV